MGPGVGGNVGLSVGSLVAISIRAVGKMVGEPVGAKVGLSELNVHPCTKVKPKLPFAQSLRRKRKVSDPRMLSRSASQKLPSSRVLGDVMVAASVPSQPKDCDIVEKRCQENA